MALTYHERNMKVLLLAQV